MGVYVLCFAQRYSLTPQYRLVWGSEAPWAGLSVIGMPVDTLEVGGLARL